MTPTQSATTEEPGRSLAYTVLDQLHQLISDQKLTPGDKLPSETVLLKELGVGRTTIREAFRLLEQEGLVRSRQGFGRTLVRRPTLHRPLTTLEGVTEMMASRGLKPANSVLSVQLMDPTEKERSALGLSRSSSIVRLERARLLDGVPAVYSVDVFDRGIINSPIAEVDWTASLYAQFEAAGRRPVSATATLSAVQLDPDVEQKFDMPRGEPWLRISQVHADADNEPLLLSEDYHRGSEFTFEVMRTR
jgi:GntR family transcriptional regulator